MTDTAADITAALNSLDGSNIASITISDNGAIGVSVAQLTSDATAISKLADQSGGLSYQLAVTDTAADITAVRSIPSTAPTSPRSRSPTMARSALQSRS